MSTRETPPDHLRCVFIQRNGKRCRSRRKHGDRCGKKSHQVESVVVDGSPVPALSAAAWKEIEQWVSEFPEDYSDAAKKVLVAVMAKGWANNKASQVIKAARALAAIVQAEAAKLTAEKPITLILGDDHAKKIGA